LDGAPFSVCPDNPQFATSATSYSSSDSPLFVTTEGYDEAYYTGLAPGVHTFRTKSWLVSVDSSDESDTITFTWTVNPT
jgi:hypothetical protein